MASEPPKVLISFSHDSPEHEQRVLELANRLRGDGIDCNIDLYVVVPEEGWPLWMEWQIRDSNFVLMVCTETYLKRVLGEEQPGKGLGVRWEGNLIYNAIYSAGVKNTKFIPLLSVVGEVSHIPTPLQGTNFYEGFTEAGYEKLYRRLSNQPQAIKQELGKLPPSERKSEGVLGRLINVPELPTHFLPRPNDIEAIKSAVLAGLNRPVVVTQSRHTLEGQAVEKVGLQGMGGIGKSVLAAALARDREVRQAFPDGIYWLAIGQTPNLPNLQGQLVRQLTGAAPGFTTEQEGKDAFREALEGRWALVVLDDVWNVDHADAFSVTAPLARLLITTRNNEVLVGLDAEEHRVEVLSANDALKMLAEWVGEKSPDMLPREAAEVAKECGYLPLALAMIGAMIRLRPTAWKDALARLRGADLGAIKKAFPGYPYPDLLRAIGVSIEALEETDRERYFDLAVFPEDHPIPESALSLLWKLNEVDTRDCMTRLITRSLGTWAIGETSLFLHDLQRDLIHKRREKDLPGLHLRLVEAWKALPKLPNAYAWRWIAYHLVKAERKGDLSRLLLDFDYLQGKLFATDPSALIADYHLLADDQELRLVQSTLRLSAHTLAHDPAQLAAQLLARIGPPQDSAVQRLLSDAKRWSDHPWLRPRLASLAETDGTLLSTFRGREADGHAGTPRSMTFSADGAWLATAGNSTNDCTVKIWNVGETRLAQTFQGAAAEGGGTPLLFLSPKRLAVANGRELRIYEMDSDKATDARTFDAQITSLAGMPGLDAVIVGLIDGTIECVEKMHVHSLLRVRDGQRVDAIVVSHDGVLIACVAGSRVECQRLADTQLVGRVDVGDDRPVGIFTTLPLAFKDDGRVLFGATLKVWIPSEVAALPALPDQEGQVVAIASAGTHALLHVDQNTVVARQLTPRSPAAYLTNTYTFSCYAITTDGSVAATGDYEHDVKLWNPAVYGRGAGRSAPVRRVEIADDSRHAVVFRSKPPTEVWDVETGGLDPLAHHPIASGSLMRNGVNLLDSSACDSVREELTTREPPRSEMDSYGNPVGALTFSRRAGRALSAPFRGGKGADIEEPPGPASSDDSMYALRVWELGSTAPPQMLHGHTMSISCVAMTPDGRLGITGSNGRLIRLWDLDRGACLCVLRGHKGRVFAVALSDDGRFAVSGSEDMSLCLWDLRDLHAGHLLYTFTGSSAILTCDIAPDASYVIAGERSGRVHLMDVAALPPVAPIGV